jgi:hypothetical protein
MSWQWTDATPEVSHGSDIAWKPHAVAIIFSLLVTVDVILLALFLFSRGFGLT